MNRKNKTAFLAVSVIAVLFTGCSVKISITARSDNSGQLQAAVAAGPAEETTLKSLTGTTLQNADTAAIAKDMEQSGFTDVTVSSDKPADIKITAVVKDLTEGIAAIPGAITCTTEKTGKRRLTITLSPEILKDAVGLLPETTQTYTDLLMAPVFTGETMTQKEYTDLLASVYGNSFSAEIAASTITLSFSDGVAAMQKFTLSLPELLTLKKSKIVSFIW